MKSTSFHSELGLGKLTLIVFGLIIGTVTFVSYHVMPFYYYYFEFQNQAEQLVRVAQTHTDEQLRDKMYTHAAWMGIPVERHDIQVKRWGEHVQIEVVYSETFSVEYDGEDHEIHTFDFHVFAEEKIH